VTPPAPSLFTRARDSGDGVVDLEEACQVSYVFVEDPDVSAQPSVVKSGGASPETFLITITNHDVGENVSGEMEIYVRFH
jgi:hypothetical protein